MRAPDAKDEPRRWLPLLSVAAGVLALHLATNGRYGWFRDELYFLACAKRLAWGYVDQPPFIAFAGRVALALFGLSLWGVRLFVALAAVGAVVLAGVFARRLGGGWYAELLAGLAVGLAPTLVTGGHLFTMNAFEPLFWTGCALGVVSLVEAPRPRTWLWMGALLGVGLLNKYSVGFFAVCLLAGVALAGPRRVLLTPWLLASAGLATLIVLPNVLWQRANGWPMLELLRNGQLYKNAPFNAGSFLGNQFLQMNPFVAPLWLAGLWFFLFSPSGRRWRALGIAFLLQLALFIAMKAKVYYLAPAYPMLFAGGAVLFERHVMKPALRATAAGVVAVTGLALSTLTIPVLPPDVLIRVIQRLGIEAPREERHAYNPLPQHLADQFGWPELVDTVARAAATLSPEERAQVTVFGRNYGEAAALELLGEGKGVPPVFSGHNQYFLWGPGRANGQVLMFIGVDRQDLEPRCRELQLAATTPDQPYAMPYENQLPVWICRGLKPPFAEVWARVRHFE